MPYYCKFSGKRLVREQPLPLPRGVLGRGCSLVLPVDGDVVDSPLVFQHKFFGLHKHATRTITGVKYSPFVGFEHVDQQFNHASWGIKLPTLFAFCQCKFTEEVFKHMPQHIGTARLGIAQGDIADQINQLPKLVGSRFFRAYTLGGTLLSEAYSSSNASEIYLRRITPKTTCLYSDASMFFLSLSADFHSYFSSNYSACLDFASSRGIFARREGAYRKYVTD